MEVTRFEIKNARIAFDDLSTHPAAEMVIDQFHLVATDIGNRPKGISELPARVVVEGRVGGSGKLRADVHADPGDEQPHFTATMEVTDLALVPIHDFLVKNALIDVRSGTFKGVPDPSKNIVERAAVKVASAVKDVLKNDNGRIATKAPFHGDFKDNRVDLWTTIANLLRNAFVQSLRQGLEAHAPS